MNGRIFDKETMAGRLAAVAKSHMDRVLARYRETHGGPEVYDYRDLEAALKPFADREEIMIRIDEAQRLPGTLLMERIKKLEEELAILERNLPDVYKL